MISLDQVLLLEQKVESAVAKIAQLNAENAALRRKCAELTNALSDKTEQFSSFQSDQNKIEEGILKALERLNTVENAVHAAAEAAFANSAAPVSTPVQPVVTEPAVTEPQISVPVINEENSFDTATIIEDNSQPENPAQNIPPVENPGQNSFFIY